MLRIDSFVQKHVEYLHGILKIVDARNTNDATVSVDEQNTNLLTSTPKNMSDSDVILHSNNLCPACQNNDQPSGAHSCYLCKKLVHVLPQCSVPLENAEEGYGELRLCSLCKNVVNIKEL